MRSTSTRPPERCNAVHPRLCRVAPPRGGISSDEPSMCGEGQRRRKLPTAGVLRRGRRHCVSATDPFFVQPG